MEVGVSRRESLVCKSEEPTKMALLPKMIMNEYTSPPDVVDTADKSAGSAPPPAALGGNRPA